MSSKIIKGTPGDESASGIDKTGRTAASGEGVVLKSDVVHAMGSAEKIIAELSASKKYSKPIVTEVMPAMPFYPAEEYHQNYLRKNPGGYCHVDLNLAAKPL